jgi:S-adenosylmethionine:tRNA ribosyltransferase-isomerase
MLTAEFDFDLPEDLIAQHPIEPRDHSRLLVLDRSSGQIEHHQFRNLPSILDSRDILTLNDTRVIPARLTGYRERTGGKWECLFLRDLADGTWEVLTTTRGRPSHGEYVIVGRGLRLVLEREADSGGWIVRPCHDENPVFNNTTLALLDRHGQTPLPPYIRKGTEEVGDRARYQTIFAEQPGSVAAPTAGLHFTRATFQDLAMRGIGWTTLTLHVGLGTFRPIKTSVVADHSMHPEWAELPNRAVTEINARRKNGGRVVAVGSTSARTLESAALTGTLIPFKSQTSLFIQPGHVFRGFDALITNFHLPRSTLLVLVSAFAGMERTREAYRVAVDHRYRFFSYGDAMLIL